MINWIFATKTRIAFFIIVLCLATLSLFIWSKINKTINVVEEWNPVKQN